jgi:UDP-glucose:(heptosyl)LPS alpha-1,3-glucosyltransferase
MRLALIRQRYDPYGGAERFVERALAALQAQGVNATLITRDWSARPGQAVLVCNPFHVGRLWRDWSFARCVRSTLGRQPFDLVQSHERIPGCDIYRAGDGVHASWLDQRDRARGVLGPAVTALNLWHRYTLRAESRMFRHPGLRAVICNSRMVRDDIQRRFGLAPEKLHVIYNGVDLESYHPRLRHRYRDSMRSQLAVASAATLFLYVGSGFARKGVPQLIEAFAAMSDRDAVLAIVGADRQQSRLGRVVRRLGLDRRILFAGGQKDVRPFYAAADAFVLPTLYDPFPNAALEALACGLPVITSTSCGAAELVTEGVNGHVCDALDVGALARCLDALARPGAALGMATAARTSVAGLSLDRMAEALIDLYRELLPDGPS